MSHIVVDDELRAKLNGLNETVEFRDASGKAVGQFVPQDEYMRLLYAWAKTAFTDEGPDGGRLTVSALVVPQQGGADCPAGGVQEDRAVHLAAEPQRRCLTARLRRNLPQHRPGGAPPRRRPDSPGSPNAGPPRAAGAGRAGCG